MLDEKWTGLCVCARQFTQFCHSRAIPSVLVQLYMRKVEVRVLPPSCVYTQNINENWRIFEENSLKIEFQRCFWIKWCISCQTSGENAKIVQELRKIKKTAVRWKVGEEKSEEKNQKFIENHRESKRYCNWKSKKVLKTCRRCENHWNILKFPSYIWKGEKLNWEKIPKKPQSVLIQGSRPLLFVFFFSFHSFVPKNQTISCENCQTAWLQQLTVDLVPCDILCLLQCVAKKKFCFT